MSYSSRMRDRQASEPQICESPTIAMPTLLRNPGIADLPRFGSPGRLGTGRMVRDPHSGRYRRTRLFVLTLGYSRKCVRLLTFPSSRRTWAELHEQTFRRLGGASKTVVMGTLGEGALKPDIYDPVLNPAYRDALADHGAVALPCRVGEGSLKQRPARYCDYRLKPGFFAKYSFSMVVYVQSILARRRGATEIEGTCASRSPRR